MLQNKLKNLSVLSNLILLLSICFLLFNLNLAHASEDDPLEPMNRVIFGFNEVIDDNVLEPVAEGYRYITPDPVENSITNFLTIWER